MQRECRSVATSYYVWDDIGNKHADAESGCSRTLSFAGNQIYVFVSDKTLRPRKTQLEVNSSDCPTPDHDLTSVCNVDQVGRDNLHLKKQNRKNLLDRAQSHLFCSMSMKPILQNDHDQQLAPFAQQTVIGLRQTRT